MSVNFSLLNENSTDLNMVVSSAEQNNITGVVQSNNSITNNLKLSIKFNQNMSEEYDFAIISTNYTSYSVAWLCKDLTNETSKRK